MQACKYGKLRLQLTTTATKNVFFSLKCTPTTITTKKMFYKWTKLRLANANCTANQKTVILNAQTGWRKLTRAMMMGGNGNGWQRVSSKLKANGLVSKQTTNQAITWNSGIVQSSLKKNTHRERDCSFAMSWLAYLMENRCVYVCWGKKKSCTIL